ncbi:hypothetical protein DW079_06090 [Segatella copri]|uniref:Uncharacterized protein n=1 Tax=Segatella copri TaxID=165179 RepID=A0A415F4U1_9BACT|nr:hypothetical protein DW079_06090 [Segatella copri]
MWLPEISGKYLKRLQKLGTFAGTFARFFRKKYLLISKKRTIFAIENERQACWRDTSRWLAFGKSKQLNNNS